MVIQLGNLKLNPYNNCFCPLSSVCQLSIYFTNLHLDPTKAAKRGILAETLLPRDLLPRNTLAAETHACSGAVHQGHS